MNKEEVVKYFEGKDFKDKAPIKIKAGTIRDVNFFVSIQLMRLNGKASKESEAAFERLIELKNILDAGN
jgi:hypothetical protein